jgi:two-component system phosphate regulon response regulator PhoB
MKTLLVIEDSKFVRIATERMLAKEGYRVIGASDGEEALSMAGKDKPDLIILDMMLPKVSGPEVLRALKLDARTSQIPVVVLSSLSQKNEEKLKNEGAAAFISKELLLQSPQVLLEAIQAALQLSALAAG